MNNRPGRFAGPASLLLLAAAAFASFPSQAQFGAAVNRAASWASPTPPVRQGSRHHRRSMPAAHRLNGPINAQTWHILGPRFLIR